MQLSEHFSVSEFEKSETAVRKGIDNSIPDELMSNAYKTATLMEKVRDLLGHPITVNSCYRSPRVNKAVGGSTTSEHMQALACDFVCPEFGTPNDICHAIMDSDIDYGQLIEEGTWVHISVKGRHENENLTMRNGRYTEGID